MTVFDKIIIVTGMETFTDIIGRWPSAAALAADLAAQGVGVQPVTVRSWRKQGIPGPYWDHLCEAAARRGLEGVTRDLLCRLGRASSNRTGERHG